LTTVATESALRTAIQRKLHTLAEQGRFFQVRYDDGKPVAIDPNAAERLSPESIAINEISSEFQPDVLTGRAVHQRRTAWQFELHLGFSNEVTATFFEEDNTKPVPRVDATQFHTYALLRLNHVEYDHPAREGSGGTSVILTWDITIGR
jgi:hypothetical protein